MSPHDDGSPCLGCAVRCAFCLKERIPAEHWPRAEGAVRVEVMITTESTSETPAPRMPAAPTNPSVAHQLKMQALVRACPHRDTSVPCGCGMAICRQNKGGGIDRSRVSLRECEACQESRLTDSP